MTSLERKRRSTFTMTNQQMGADDCITESISHVQGNRGELSPS